MYAAVLAQLIETTKEFADMSYMLVIDFITAIEDIKFFY